eukprot:scaffold153799_cov29-Tisochrysis_lutea.AAC.11
MLCSPCSRTTRRPIVDQRNRTSDSFIQRKAQHASAARVGSRSSGCHGARGDAASSGPHTG